MPMLWRRVAWMASFATGVLAAIWMQILGYGWAATFGMAAATCLLLPFTISQLCALSVSAGTHSRVKRGQGLAERIAEAVKGLPPDEQEAVALRMTEEAFTK
jgi:hypothetical protein